MIIQKKERDTVFLVNNIFDQIASEYTHYGQDLLSDPEVIEAFAKRDRKKLYDLTLPIYEHLKKQNKYLYIMHFHTADTHSFLRVHKPKKFGDDLSDLRPIIVKTNESQKMYAGIEVGKFGLYYRVTFPVFKEEKYIGAFEFGVDVKHLMSRISKLNVFTPVLLLRKEAVAPIYKYDKSANQYLSPFSKDYALLKYKPLTKDKISIVDLVDSRIINENSYIASKNDKEHLIFHAYDLRDYKNSLIGHFIFIDEMDYYMDTIIFLRWVSIITTLLLVVIIVGLIYKLINNYTAELHKQKDNLDYQAHHDSLTGLPNRVLFNDRLNQAIIKAKRKQRGLALFFIDLDRFKQINDSLGHVIGDEVLKIISVRLKSIVRQEDTIARLGGDEFTVLIEDLRKVTDASLLAKKILYTLSEPIYIEGHTLYISGSIGISLYPEDDTDTNNLLKYADAAMYKAKEEGRNNFQYYSSDMTELAFQKVVMEANLRKALEDEELIVHFQPQIDARSNKLIGMEALVRWQHPSDGLIYPDKFIPLAEETGLIIQLDQLVMHQAMKQLVIWYEKGLNPGVLALNLAIKQLQKDDFISVLDRMLKDTGCKPEWLELEVTEGEIMKNPENAIKVLNEISNMGIELAIDDFGTGYSSLSYLKRLPIDKLKIDKSFVDGLPGNDEDVGITKAVIALAKSLKLNVLAEGVENKEQKEFLLENGCENIQGYFYAKPMSAVKMEIFLKEYS
ncbi:MAG: EAL domain-containing protein [Sulfurimonas sp.]|nr:EAL domain-containing protein [Sulfurimonas sp.]